MEFVVMSDELNPRDQALVIDRPNLDQLVDMILEALDVG
jgi:hypothetical protein